MNTVRVLLDLFLQSQTMGRMSADAAPSPAPAASHYPDPFMYTAPGEPGLPLILASPHSGRVYPASMRAALCVPLIDVQRTEDAFVDELILPAGAQGAGLLMARYARAFVDLNRDPGELDPRMFRGRPPRRCGPPGPRVQAGLGCLPRVGARGAPIYAGRLSSEEAERRLAEVHDVYHAHLTGELERLRALHGAVFLIDVHSMPSRQPGRRRLADIVLGDRFGSSCTSRLTSLVERQFRRQGLSVARNTPYAGGYTTLRYGRPALERHALQIEVRRDLYLDEMNVRKTDDFAELARIMSLVFAEICAFAANQSGQWLSAAE